MFNFVNIVCQSWGEIHFVIGPPYHLSVRLPTYGFLCVTTRLSVMTKTSVSNIIPQAKANHYKRYVQNDTKQKQKYRGMFETQMSRNKTNSGDIGTNIRTLASPKVGQDQVSGGVSVLCWHAAPVANVLWKPLAIRQKVKFGNNCRYTQKKPQ